MTSSRIRARSSHRLRLSCFLQAISLFKKSWQHFSCTRVFLTAFSSNLTLLFAMTIKTRANRTIYMINPILNLSGPANFRAAKRMSQQSDPGLEQFGLKKVKTLIRPRRAANTRGVLVSIRANCFNQSLVRKNMTTPDFNAVCHLRLRCVTSFSPLVCYISRAPSNLKPGGLR